jgi:hypothetical protein
MALLEGKHDGKQVLSKEGIITTLPAHTIHKAAIRDPDFALTLQYGLDWAMSAYKGNNFYQHGRASFVEKRDEELLYVYIY